MKAKPIKLDKTDREVLIIAMKKIIGQMNAIQTTIEKNEVTDLTFNQLLAIKGGTNRICKEIIAQGVIPNLKNYNQQEINRALEIIFKLD